MRQIVSDTGPLLHLHEAACLALLEHAGTIAIPKAVDSEIVQQGWFRSEEEVLRFALLEFLRRHPLELYEQFQREDIAWALRQKDAVE